MGTEVLLKPRIWLGAYQIDADMFSMAGDFGNQLQQANTFGDVTEKFKAGVSTFGFAGRGYFDADESPSLIDDILAVQLPPGTSDVALTYTGLGTQTEGDATYLTRLTTADYNPFAGADHGGMHEFSIRGVSQGDPLVRGAIIHQGAETSTGNGTEYTTDIGAVVAGSTVYGTLHVTSVTGSGTIDVTVEHDITGFGTPATAFSFAQKAAIGHAFGSSSTTTTDEFWRATWTISGFSSVTFVVAVGVSTQ